MMNNKELPQSIIDALEKGAFSTLDQSLQKSILEYMSSQEFDEYRNVIKDFKIADEHLESELIQSTGNAAIPTSQATTISLSWWKGAAAAALIGLSSFSLGRATADSDCKNVSSDMMFAYQDTMGRSLAEDTIRKSLWQLFDKEML